MPTTDDDLAARIQRHDVEALGLLLARHRERLLGYVERNLGAALRRKVEPSDVVQEVSLAAVRLLPSTDFTSMQPLAWLCHLAEQRIIDAHRKFFGAQKRAAQREVPLAGGQATDGEAGLIHLLAASMTTPSQAFSRNEKQLRLLGAMESLPPDARQALQLRYVEGLSTKDIARRLGRTDGAIRVLLTRSIKRLQELLDT